MKNETGYPDLDVLIAEKIFGWCWQIRSGSINRWFGAPDAIGSDTRFAMGPVEKMPDMEIYFEKPVMGGDEVPQYSTDIKAAWEIVHVMLSRGYSHTLDSDSEAHCSRFSSPLRGFYHKGPTPALAICLAALAVWRTP